jgi:hypothetical protein
MYKLKQREMLKCAVCRKKLKTRNEVNIIVKYKVAL